MVLKIYNTLTRQKEEFKPINNSEVGVRKLVFLTLYIVVGDRWDKKKERLVFI